MSSFATATSRAADKETPNGKQIHLLVNPDGVPEVETPKAEPQRSPETAPRAEVAAPAQSQTLEEADRVAHRIAIIDHGAIVAQGTPAELKQQTNSETLEQAFLALTGSSIREEGADANQSMRNMAQMWRRKR